MIFRLIFMNENLKYRVLEYCKRKNIAKSTFEKKAGLSNGYFNQVKKRPSLDKIESIRYAFPDININWLLTGEGEMLVQPTQVTPARGRIRYWMDVDATGGFKELAEDGMSGRYMDIDIPEFRECHDACNIYGDSMSPLYKNGQIIILKEWTENFIEYGNVYLIITKSGNRMVKFLKKGSDDAHVLCASENPEYDPFEIEKSDILKLYAVKGGISKNAL